MKSFSYWCLNSEIKESDILKKELKKFKILNKGFNKKYTNLKQSERFINPLIYKNT